MKKIGLVIIMIVLLATVANAASVNGDFEGNPIIKMKSDGKTLAVEDVPAILYNGRTMVPIGMLRELGVGVSWDQKTQSVDVALPTIGVDVSQLAIDTKSSGINFVGYFSDGEGFDRLTYYYDGLINNLINDSVKLADILINGASTNVYLIEIIGDNNEFFNVPNQAVKDFFDGKITGKQLTDQYKVNKI